MRICDLFAKGEPVISFEFFPPKTDAGMEALYGTIAALKPCGPSFVSVTYGTGGGSRNLTIDLVERVKRELGIETLAHLTCADATKGDILIMCRRLVTAGIENVLALRGDPPDGSKEFRKPEGGFAHANELIEFIREEGFDFCVGAACYPEAHPETPDLEQDLVHLKRKVDSGVDFLISQLFFDNQEYVAFVRRARRAGVTVPILPGLMPVTNVTQIERFTKTCGARIPQELFRRLKIVEQDPAAVVATGVYWTTVQARRLLETGAPGLHFYTLNKSSATLAVHAALGL